MCERLLLLLLLPLLLSPSSALAVELQCTGAPIESSLTDDERAERLADQAIACVKERKAIQAIALLSELIGIDPDNAQAYLNRGSSYVRVGEFGLGLRDYDRVIELEPNRFEGWYNRGSTHLAAREYDEAVADLTQTIRLKPDLAYAYCNRGLAFLRQADREKARADFKRGLELRVDVPLCYYGRGEIELADGEYREAIDDLTRGINFKPTAEALAQRATAYERLGESEKALNDYRKALSLRPRLKEAQTGIARLTQNNQN